MAKELEHPNPQGGHKLQHPKPHTLRQELEKELKRARWEAIKLEETRRATEAEAQVSLGRHS
jgi:hypothetical protein